MGDAKLSTTKAMYYPPALMPGYMGQFIPIKHGYGSLYDRGNVNYFHDHRNENFSMPSEQWGLQSCTYTPRPDLVAADRIINLERMLQQPVMPLSETVTDSIRRQEVDNFYLICQKHRDQYKDHSGQLHPLDFFVNADYKWQCPPDPTRIYLKFPQYYVKYRTPPVLPYTLERCGKIPPLPDRSFHGRYARESDISYKR